MNRYLPGDIVTVPNTGGPKGCRVRCVVIEGPRTYTRTPFERRTQPHTVTAVHLRYLEGLENGEPVTFQVEHLLPA